MGLVARETGTQRASLVGMVASGRATRQGQDEEYLASTDSLGHDPCSLAADDSHAGFARIPSHPMKTDVHPLRVTDGPTSVSLEPPLDAEATLVRWLPQLDAVARSVARSRGLGADDVDDFVAELHLKMVGDSYHAVRAFEGRCSLAVYLRVIASRFLVDHLNARWGRWRPSARARELGEVGVEFERLVACDGMADAEAAAVLRSRGYGEAVETAERTLRPSRPRPREELDPDAGVREPAAERADSAVERDDRSHRRIAAERALLAAIGALDREDRLLLRLRFGEGATVREVAARLRLPARPLYRRFESLLGTLRAELVERGWSRGEIAELIGTDPPLAAIPWWKLAPIGQSSEGEDL